MGCGMLALDLTRQLPQLIQQLRLLVGSGRSDGMGQCGKFALHVAEDNRGLSRFRQSKQCRHAVGLDFQQLLHEAPQGTPGNVAREDAGAREPIVQQREDRVDLGASTRHDGPDECVFVERSPDGLCRQSATGQHPHLRCGQAAARDSCKPLLGNISRRASRHTVRTAGRLRARERPRDELSVQFPP